MQRGVTLLELVIVLTIVGIVMGMAFPRAGDFLDRIAVSRSAGELASFYQSARFAAIFRAQRVRIEFGQDSLRATFEGVKDSTFLVWPGPTRHRVALTASRDVIRVHPNGFGWGGANTKLVVRRGMAAESLTTSRLGRLKRWR